MYNIIFKTIRNKLTASGYFIHSILNYKLMGRSATERIEKQQIQNLSEKSVAATEKWIFQ